MNLTTMLIQEIIPLYAMILMGFIAGKWLGAQGKNIANILFYMLIPLVVFDGVWRAEITPHTILLPLVAGGISTIAAFVFLHLSRPLFGDARANLVSLSSGVSNTGYLGIPLAVVVLPEPTVWLYITTILGVILFQNSVGYYIAARGKHDARDAFLRVAKLPTLYGFVVAVVLSVSQVEPPAMFENFFGYVRGAYVVFGMMVIGVGLSRITSLSFDVPFMTLNLFARFVGWPLLALGFILLDYHVLGWYDREIYMIFVLMSVIPLAADTVSIATLLDTHVEQMATTVLLSTLFALIYIPLMLPVFFALL